MKHNTAKYLLGITPIGSVSFLSIGSGGGLTDDHLTGESGFFNKLLSGDVAMANQGFRLDDCTSLTYKQHCHFHTLCCLVSRSCLRLVARFVSTAEVHNYVRLC